MRKVKCTCKPSKDKENNYEENYKFQFINSISIIFKSWNITVKANALDVRAQEAEQNEFSVMSETETEEVHEVNNEDCTEV